MTFLVTANTNIYSIHYFSSFSYFMFWLCHYYNNNKQASSVVFYKSLRSINSIQNLKRYDIIFEYRDLSGLNSFNPTSSHFTIPQTHIMKKIRIWNLDGLQIIKNLNEQLITPSRKRLTTGSNGNIDYGKNGPHILLTANTRCRWIIFNSQYICVYIYIYI